MEAFEVPVTLYTPCFTAPGGPQPRAERGRARDAMRLNSCGRNHT